jgi:hypothetical protein
LRRWFWRCTLRIKGKSACVALSEEQASHTTQAIEDHKNLAEIVREMCEITQTLILETVPGARRRKLISEIPKASWVSAIRVETLPSRRR